VWFFLAVDIPPLREKSKAQNKFKCSNVPMF
jgi:hypothetical protein